MGAPRRMTRSRVCAPQFVHPLPVSSLAGSSRHDGWHTLYEAHCALESIVAARCILERPIARPANARTAVHWSFETVTNCILALARVPNMHLSGFLVVMGLLDLRVRAQVLCAGGVCCAGATCVTTGAPDPSPPTPPPSSPSGTGSDSCAAAGAGAQLYHVCTLECSISDFSS